MKRFGNFGAEVPEIAETGLIRLKGSITGPLREASGSLALGAALKHHATTAAVTGQNREGDPSEANGIVASPEKLQPPVRDVASDVALSRSGLGLPTAFRSRQPHQHANSQQRRGGRQKGSARLPRDVRVPTSGAS